MKPFDRIFAGMPLCRAVDGPTMTSHQLTLAVWRMAKLLDEQHAAGQVPMAAVGAEPKCEHRRCPSCDGCVDCSGLCGHSICAGLCAPVATPDERRPMMRIEALSRMKAAPVAAPPAQPAPEPRCSCRQGASRLYAGGGHADYCPVYQAAVAHLNVEAAQPTAVEPALDPRQRRANTEALLRSMSKPRTTVKRFALELKLRISRVEKAFDQPGQEGHVTGARHIQGVVDALLSDYDTRDPEDFARQEAVPVAPSHPFGGLCNCRSAQIHSLPHERGCPGYRETAANNPISLGNVWTGETGPAVPVAGERLPYSTQLEAFTTVNSNISGNSAQHIEARQALNWLHERLCETQDRLEHEQRDHEETRGYRQHAEQLRDSALSQVETLQAGKLEAERLAAALSAASKELEAKLRTAVDDCAFAVSGRAALLHAADKAVTWFDTDGSVGASEDAMAPLRELLISSPGR